MKRTSEEDIALLIVSILRARRDKAATIRELVAIIPSRIKLTRADRQKSPSRPAEQLWEQRVRNIRSHQSGKQYGLRNVAGGFVLIERRYPAAATASRGVHAS